MRTLKLYIACQFALCSLAECRQPALAAIPAKYKVIDLGVLPTEPSTTAGLYPGSGGARVNSSGQVTGSSSVGTENQGMYPQHAFLYDGTLHDLGSITHSGIFDYSEGTDINDNGHVVGASLTRNGDFRAILYDGTVHILGALGGSYSRAWGINSFGQIVGEDGGPDGAFLWQPTSPNSSSGTMFSLGTLSTEGFYNTSGAADINDLGHVTGYTYVNGGEKHAFLWVPSTPNGTSGTMHDVGTLGGKYAFPRAINANGLVVGSSQTANGLEHAFLWMPDTLNGTSGSMLDLGKLSTEYSDAFDINSEGDVVGYYLDGAFIYNADVGMINLNTLIDPQSPWYLYAAFGINDAGQITGSGEINGQFHAFLLNPVPEPASAVALASILGFTVLMRTRGFAIHPF